MAAVERILLRAVEHFEAGRPQQADALCGEVLKAHPDHVPALHLSAVVAFVTERASDGRCCSAACSASIPTMRLFRQHKPQAWESVLTRVSAE